MGGYPFPDDRLALARLDYCSPVGCSNALSCSIRARQCGSHLQASGDEKKILSAGPVLNTLLGPPDITAWEGACPSVSATGVCNLLTADRFADDLWYAFGEPRMKSLYSTLAGERTASPLGTDQVRQIALG